MSRWIGGIDGGDPIPDRRIAGETAGERGGGLLYINFIIIFLLRYCGFSLSSQCMFMYCDITRGEFLLVEVTLVGS